MSKTSRSDSRSDQSFQCTTTDGKLSGRNPGDCFIVRIWSSDVSLRRLANLNIHSLYGLRANDGPLYNKGILTRYPSRDPFNRSIAALNPNRILNTNGVTGAVAQLY